MSLHTIGVPASNCAHPGCGRRIWNVGPGRWTHSPGEDPPDGHEATNKPPIGNGKSDR